MKSIQPIQIWTASGTKTAEFFDARIIADDLETSATFYWNLNASSVSEDGSKQLGEQLADGNCTMDGADYQAWDGNNDAAYQYVASKIGVVII